MKSYHNEMHNDNKNHKKMEIWNKETQNENIKNKNDHTGT